MRLASYLVGLVGVGGHRLEHSGRLRSSVVVDHPQQARAHWALQSRDDQLGFQDAKNLPMGGEYQKGIDL